MIKTFLIGLFGASVIGCALWTTFTAFLFLGISPATDNVPLLAWLLYNVGRVVEEYIKGKEGG